MWKQNRIYMNGIVKIFLFFLLSGVSFGQTLNDFGPISTSSALELNDKAYGLYVDGLWDMNHVNPEDAISKIKRAADLTDNVELKLLSAQMCRFRGRMKFGQKSEYYYSLAEETIKQVKEDKLTTNTVSMYYYLVEVIPQERSGLVDRDLKRLEAGRKFRKEYAKDRFRPAPYTRERPKNRKYHEILEKYGWTSNGT